MWYKSLRIKNNCFTYYGLCFWIFKTTGKTLHQNFVYSEKFIGLEVYINDKNITWDILNVSMQNIKNYKNKFDSLTNLGWLIDVRNVPSERYCVKGFI